MALVVKNPPARAGDTRDSGPILGSPMGQGEDRQTDGWREAGGGEQGRGWGVVVVVRVFKISYSGRNMDIYSKTLIHVQVYQYNVWLLIS